MSGLFSSKKQTPEVSVVADPYKQVRNPLMSWLGGQIGQPGQTYTGQLVSPMTAQETQSLDFLKQFAQRQPSTTTTAAKSMIEGTLGGQYDPTKSPYYQAVKAEAMRNLGDVQAGIASQAAGGGRYWTGARLQEQREAGTDVANALNTMLGQLSEQERGRQMSILPSALQLGQQEEMAPLQTTQALQQYGALPRTIQQALDQATYNEWLRSTQEWPLNIAQLAGQIQQPPEYAFNQYQPSLFSQFSPMLAQIIPSMLKGLSTQGGVLPKIF